MGCLADNKTVDFDADVDQLDHNLDPGFLTEILLLRDRDNVVESATLAEVCGLLVLLVCYF